MFIQLYPIRLEIKEEKKKKKLSKSNKKCILNIMI